MRRALIFGGNCSAFGNVEKLSFFESAILIFFFKKIFFCFIPMKISHKLCVRMDGTQFLILWWLREWYNCMSVCIAFFLSHSKKTFERCGQSVMNKLLLKKHLVFWFLTMVFVIFALKQCSPQKLHMYKKHLKEKQTYSEWYSIMYYAM